MRAPNPSITSPRARFHRPSLQTHASPSETLLGTPRSPFPFASLVRPFRRAFPDPRAQRPSRRPEERMALPDRREDLLHRHHRGAHPSQVPQTPGHLDRDPRAGPTHRRRPRRHRRAPHGDRDRRRSLSWQRRLPLRRRVRPNLPHRRLQARGLGGRPQHNPNTAVQSAAGLTAPGQHVLQPGVRVPDEGTRAKHDHRLDRAPVPGTGDRRGHRLTGQRTAVGRHRDGDGAPGAGHQGTIRRR